MISHKHKCIFIHIAKCAGTSIEHAFGVDVENHNADENQYLFGWDSANKIWIQHATPQQLLDLNYISKEVWSSYYKFVVYRNSWDRAYSDYLWMLSNFKVEGSFFDFLKKRKDFKRILTDRSSNDFVGDHLNIQKEYFFLNGERISYDAEIDFEKLNEGFLKVKKDLGLKEHFFREHLNKSKEVNKPHYSKFYGFWKKRLVARLYKEDIDFFSFQFNDNRSFMEKIKGLIR